MGAIAPSLFKEARMAKKVSSSLYDRLYERVTVDGDCLLWQGATSGKSKYGQIRIDGQKQRCHRVSYQLHKGDIPEGMIVMHSCDTPLCINPSHLSLGTQVENMADMRSKGREHHNQGDGNGRSSLCAADAADIRASYQRYSRNFGSTALAKKYGVSDQAILDVVSGKTWST
jgi:hypothetical protein